ncbi:MAG: hypothetical protein LBM95_04530 [Lactobacillales bacterium]|jgi:ABC-2 type transport system permease protein|nr:hypothetical protein [Lactobacillales bacterium]
MNNLTFLTFKNLLKKKETIVYFVFALFPFLLIIVDLFDTNFMQLSAPDNSLSCLGFIGAVMTVQHQLVLPLIILIYLVSTTFYTEITNGILFLYKDMNRRKILNAKIFSLIGVYISYVGILFLSSLVTYYAYLKNLSYTSGTFLPLKAIDIQDALLEILGIVFVGLLCILLATTLSLNFSSGFTMLGTVLFLLLSSIAPKLTMLKYFFPNGYEVQIDTIGFIPAILGTLIVFIVYAVFMYGYANKKFKKVEY